MSVWRDKAAAQFLTFSSRNISIPMIRLQQFSASSKRLPGGQLPRHTMQVLKMLDVMCLSAAEGN